MQLAHWQHEVQNNNWSGSDQKSAYYKTHQKDEAFDTQKYLLQINLITLTNHVKRDSNHTILEFKEVEDNNLLRLQATTNDKFLPPFLQTQASLRCPLPRTTWRIPFFLSRRYLRARWGIFCKKTVQIKRNLRCSAELANKKYGDNYYEVLETTCM